MFSKAQTYAFPPSSFFPKMFQFVNFLELPHPLLCSFVATTSIASSCALLPAVGKSLGYGND